MRPVVTPVADGTEGAKFEWVLQLHHPAAHPAVPIYQRWAEDIVEASGGRLRITIHPVNTVVPLMETLGAVTAGTLDGAVMWGPFWRGLDPVLALACGQTSGLTAREFDAWVHSYGGLELIAEAFGRHNIHYIPAIPNPPETFLWAHRPIRTAQDLQGLKLRSAGFSLDAFTAMGAAASFIPGGETPPALMKRVVDAAEFGAMMQDVAVGFHEAAKYAMVGPRAPVISDDMMINRDRWNALPVDLQQIFTSITLRYVMTGHVELMRLDQRAMQTALEKGTVFVPVPDALITEFRTRLDSILDAEAARNPNFAKVWSSLRSFRDDYRRFTETLYPWK